MFTGWLTGLWERLNQSWEADPDECQRRFPAIFRGAAESTLPDDEALAGLDVPTLVLAWTGDPGHPVSTAARQGERLPRAEVEIDDDAERIARWPQRVLAFLDERM